MKWRLRYGRRVTLATADSRAGLDPAYARAEAGIAEGSWRPSKLHVEVFDDELVEWVRWPSARALRLTQPKPPEKSSWSREVPRPHRRFARKAAKPVSRQAPAAEPYRPPERFTVDDVLPEVNELSPAGMACESRNWILRGLYQEQWTRYMNPRTPTTDPDYAYTYGGGSGFDRFWR